MHDWRTRIPLLLTQGRGRAGTRTVVRAPVEAGGHLQTKRGRQTRGSCAQRAIAGMLRSAAATAAETRAGGRHEQVAPKARRASAAAATPRRPLQALSRRRATRRRGGACRVSPATRPQARRATRAWSSWRAKAERRRAPRAARDAERGGVELGGAQRSGEHCAAASVPHLPVCLPERNQIGSPCVIRSGMHTTKSGITTFGAVGLK